MDIKDELNEMLASLQNNSKSVASHKPDSNSEPKINKTLPTDKMSVDDLINVLSASKPAPKKEPEPKKKTTSTANIPSELLNILNTGTMKKPVVPTNNKPQKHTVPEENNAATTTVSNPVIKEISPLPDKPQKKYTPETHTDKSSDFVNKNEAADTKSTLNTDIPADTSKEATVEISPPVTTVIEEKVVLNNTQNEIPDENIQPIIQPEIADESETAPLPQLKKKKSKKIVINHDLPDYEALRKESLGLNETVIEESIIVNEEPKMDEPNKDDTASETYNANESNNIPKAFAQESSESNNVFNSSEIEEEFPPKKNAQKFGLFSKFKSAINKNKNHNDDINEEEASENEAEITIAEDNVSEEAESDNSVNDNINSEDAPLEYTYEELDSLPTNELIDAVLGKDNGITDSVSNQEYDDSENTYTETSNEAVAYDDTAEEKTDISVSDTDQSEEPENNDSEATEEKADEININVEPPKAKNPVIAFLENVLNENPEEISDAKKSDSDYDDIDVSVSGKSKFKKHFYSFVGILLFVFAIVGFTFSVGEGIKFARRFTSGEDKKSEYINTIYPAVIMDIEAFNSPSELSSDQIITASTWAFIMSGDIEKYEHTLDMVSVPAVDIEKYATELFGTNLPSIEHHTVGSGDVKFYYNADSKSYNIPVNPVMFSYKPDISAISKNGDIHTVEVKYIQETPSWMSNTTKYSKVYAKIVKFKLRKTETNYTINSMEVISVNS
ncbi:MAG: hypothetical protein E7499_06150, partial [Ruminococcus sp.]|nr:hypothetical protein [Ruminococcus sp.]